MKIERLLVVRRLSEEIPVRWLCLCDCGKTTAVFASNLGRTKSCGCYLKDVTIARCLKHGHTAQGKISPEYQAWNAMFQRCYNPNVSSFRHYGARGIQVCVRWHRSTPNAFENFLSDMGPRPAGLTLDRINNEVSYMPSNCRWATLIEQRNNQRSRGKYNKCKIQ
jgi:hypothetical protein